MEWSDDALAIFARTPSDEEAREGVCVDRARARMLARFFDVYARTGRLPRPKAERGGEAPPLRKKALRSWSRMLDSFSFDFLMGRRSIFLEGERKGNKPKDQGDWESEGVLRRHWKLDDGPKGYSVRIRCGLDDVIEHRGPSWQGVLALARQRLRERIMQLDSDAPGATAAEDIDALWEKLENLDSELDYAGLDRRALESGDGSGVMETPQTT